MIKYKIGSKFKGEIGTYVLAAVNYGLYGLINIENGNRYWEPMSFDELCKLINNSDTLELIEHCEEIHSDIKNTAIEIVDLVERKNRDYGNSFDKTMDEYGSTAYFLRLDDKISRLKKLIKSNDDPEVNESIEDTLKDIIGYTLLMINYQNK